MSQAQQIEFPYPFCREEYSEMDEDGFSTAPTWRPGTRTIERGHSDQALEADGVGAQILTVIARFKPEGWPERVFYTRQWRDPDGKVFGKRKLLIRAAGAFTELTRGYRHHVEIKGRNAF